MTDKLEAIFYPLISRTLAGYLIFFSMVLIALCILFLPSQKESTLMIFVIPDALVMGQKSDFSFALSITYSLSVYLSLTCSFLTTFARGDLKGLSQIRGAQSISFRILGDALIIIFIWLLLTHEFIPMNKNQFSYTFFSTLLHDRYLALMWVEGVFAFTYCMTLICLFDISILLKRIICK